MRAERKLLDVIALAKRFGGVCALDDASLTVLSGEIHALLGANGAGKSTLIKILAGVFSADSGRILVDGEELNDASRRRLAFVHQDLGLVDTQSIAENMALGYGFPRRGPLIDWKRSCAEAEAALAKLGVTLPVDEQVWRLTRAEKSVVAIARALSREAEIVVLDEPTASLPEADVAQLFEVLRRLKALGAGVVLVTHRLDEVFRIADAVTVLRDGRTVAVSRPLTLSAEDLVKAIVGFAPAPLTRAKAAGRAPIAIELVDVCVGAAGPVSLVARAGEILGLAGLRGAGHEEIGRALAGVANVRAGEIRLGGRKVVFSRPSDAISAGVSFSTGRRAEEALAPAMTVKENLFLNPLNFGAKLFLPRDRAKEREAAIRTLKPFDVRPLDPDRGVMTLSGGNQQKVVLARCAGRKERVLVLEEPTIGVDFGAKAEIHRILARDADAGSAVVIISSDLDELALIADRVLAFSRGTIAAELDHGSLTLETLTHAVSGLRRAA